MLACIPSLAITTSLNVPFRCTHEWSRPFCYACWRCGGHTLFKTRSLSAGIRFRTMAQRGRVQELGMDRHCSQYPGLLKFHITRGVLVTQVNYRSACPNIAYHWVDVFASLCNLKAWGTRHGEFVDSRPHATCMELGETFEEEVPKLRIWRIISPFRRAALSDSANHNSSLELTLVSLWVFGRLLI